MLMVEKDPSSKQRPYRSCGLVMTPKYSITYGKYEVHAKIDKGDGWQGIIELVPTDEKDHSNVALACMFGLISYYVGRRMVGYFGRIYGG